MDLETIKKTYEGLPDARLMFIAQHEANQLMPEAQKLLISEIKKRSLDVSLLSAIEKQVVPMAEKDFEVYLKLMQELPCPYCGISLEPLTAAIVQTRKIQVIKVGCPDCLAKAIDNCSNTTTAVGIWSIFGFFKTVSKVSKNDEMKMRVLKRQTANIFSMFVRNNIGAIEMRKKSKLELVEYLKTTNKEDHIFLF